MKGMYVMKRTFCVIAVLLLALSLCGCAQKAPEGPTWQEQYDLGVKYLSEGNYEEAIIAFNAAIEIDPKRPEAYIGLADAYTAQGDLDKAAEILNQALEAVGENEALSAALAESSAASGDPGIPMEPGEVVRTKRQDLNDGMYQIWEYDASDHVVLLTRYNADGSVYFVHDYFYDAQGNNVAASITYPDGEGSLRREFTFDLSGRTIKEIDYRANGVIRTDEFLYSGTAVTISLQSVSPEEGSAASSFVYTMSAEDHEVDVYNMSSWSYETGSFNYVEVTEWDAQGNEVAVNAFDGSGNPVEVRS